jgi:mono/diheme cytochrome c family protein
MPHTASHVLLQSGHFIRKMAMLSARFRHSGRETVLFYLALSLILLLTACQANQPGDIEALVAQEAKKLTLAGKDLKNPVPDDPQSVATGKEHFQHHCQICHGMDGHGTGVPFASRMSPPVANLSDKDVQEFTDGQLKVIIQNGIRFTGMPGFEGILDENEMWQMVRFIRHLPPPGSEGIPAVYKEEQEEHEKAERQPQGKAGQHQHSHGEKHQH